MTFGKYKGQPITSVPDYTLKYYKSFGVNTYTRRRNRKIFKYIDEKFKD